MPTSNRMPKYGLHKQSGQAHVVIDGKHYLLGPHGSDESWARYHELIRQHLDRKRARDAGITVAQLLALFWRFCKKRYGKGKGRYGNAVNWRPIIRLLRSHYGKQLAADLGPRAIKAIIPEMEARGWARTHINKQLERVRKIFKWAASEELIPVTTAQAIGLVEGLRMGDTYAHETEPIGPVEDGVVDKTLTHLKPHVAAMVQFQRLTACRPAEVCKLMVGDIDRDGEIWKANLDKHKTRHHEHDRTIYIGPAAQDVIRPYLLRPADRPVFPPRRGATKGYTTDSYRRCIHRATTRYNREHPEAPIPQWCPNQLRHSGATAIREEFGLEHAQAILGHSRLQTTQIHAEKSQAKAEEVARKLG